MDTWASTNVLHFLFYLDAPFVKATPWLAYILQLLTISNIGWVAWPIWDLRVGAGSFWVEGSMGAGRMLL